MKKLLLTLTLVTTFSSSIVVYDPNSSIVTNRVIAYLQSEDTVKWNGKTNILINPSVPANSTRDNWKVVNGNVVELTQAEKDAITAANNAATVVANKEDAKANYDASAIDRAIVLVLLNEINVLRSQVQMARTNTTAFQSATNRSAVNLNDRTAAQARTAIRNEVDAQ